MHSIFYLIAALVLTISIFLTRGRGVFLPWVVRVLWFCFFFCLGGWFFFPQSKSGCWMGFGIDSIISSGVLLIFFMSAIVHSFSLRFMAFDRCFRSHWLQMNAITLTALGSIISDSIVLIACFWIANQIFLFFLITHKRDWKASREGGRFFLRTASMGCAALALGLLLLAYWAESFSLYDIRNKAGSNMGFVGSAGLFLVFLAASIQAGIWPFHKWLLSSLNAPTPVSALMHAGLVNGGGLLIVRLSPIALKEPLFLKIFALFGLISMVLGTLWKLVQPHVKKMLACSTVAQMGCLFLQCGLGLFPAAIAHICFHGMFKGFLFLQSGSYVQSSPVSEKPVKFLDVCFSIIFGIGGAFVFALASGCFEFIADTRLFWVAFVGITSFHLSLSVMRSRRFWRLLFAFAFSLGFGLFYGGTFWCVEMLFAPLGMFSPQPLDIFYGLIAFFLALSYILINFGKRHWEQNKVYHRAYVHMLNQSESDPATMTVVRSQYNF